MKFLDVSAWTVAKFGGSSVSSAARWARIQQIVAGHRAAGQRVLVVCSAVAGVTDRLIALDEALRAGAEVSSQLVELATVHYELASALGLDGRRLLAAELASLGAQTKISERTPEARAALLSHGELMSSRLGAAFLARSFRTSCVDARTLLVAEPAADGATRYLSARCPDEPVVDVRRVLASTGAEVVVSQGFIASAAEGGTALLGRGGSDASAAYLAAAIDAHALEIWSDVPGLFTADPRHVPGARLLRRLEYREAQALASLGAKALHPRALEPCQRRGIVLRLGWTDRPDVEGTRIGAMRSAPGARGVTSRNDLALISVERPAVWQPVGFLAAVSEIVQRRDLPIDLLTSSPAEIRFTLDLAGSPAAREELPALVDELAKVGRTTRWSRVGCISAIGVRDAPPAFRATTPLLVAHAADGSHVSVVVDHRELTALTKRAHEELFGARTLDPTVFGPRWDQLRAPRVAPVREEVACPIPA